MADWGWRLIGTCPRDPNYVHLVWNGAVAQVGIFWPVEGQGWFHIKPNGEEGRRMKPQPTHWMPIPEDPA